MEHTPNGLLAIATLKTLRNQMKTAFIGRDNEIDGMLTALIAKTHCLLLGPPGTAKSLVTQVLANALESQQGDYFQLLLTSFSTPDEVFGGPDLPALDRGEGLKRDVQGYLPTARTAFLDEIFKANSAILNALLTMLNERQFDNGGKRMKCPLSICIGASNEYPEDSSLEALYDRFQLRFWVSYLGSRNDRKRLLLCPDPASVVNAKLTPPMVSELQKMCSQVTVPDTVLEALLDIAEKLADDHNMIISDRRLRSSIKLVQAKAVLEGRTTAKSSDLLVLADSLWHRHEERPNVLSVVLEFANTELVKVSKLADAANEIVDELSTSSANTDLEKASSKIRQIEGEAKSLFTSMARDNEDRDAVLELMNDIVIARKSVARMFRKRNPSLSGIINS